MSGFVYNGEVIDFTAELAPEYESLVVVTIEDYAPFVEGTTSVDE